MLPVNQLHWLLSKLARNPGVPNIQLGDRNIEAKANELVESRVEASETSGAQMGLGTDTVDGDTARLKSLHECDEVVQLGTRIVWRLASENEAATRK